MSVYMSETSSVITPVHDWDIQFIQSCWLNSVHVLGFADDVKTVPSPRNLKFGSSYSLRPIYFELESKLLN